MADERKRTSLHNKLKGYLATVNANKTSPLTYVTAKELMLRVEETWEEFKVIQRAFENSAADDSAFKVQETKGNEVEDTFSDVRGKLRVLVELLTTSFNSSRSATSSTPAATPVPIKLPTISLPTFDGNYGDWTSFKDLFVAAVANNKELSGAQKLQYLKGTLTGEPFDLVQYLTATDANYTEAWKTLTERYDNTREIIRSHGFKLLDMKPVRNENAKDLQQLVDTTVKCLKSLKLAGCDTDHWDDLVILILEKKLDPATRREWAKSQTGTKANTLDELTKFLTGHIRGLQAAGTAGATHTPDRRWEKQVRVNHVAAEAVSCQFCKGTHGLTECRDFREKGAAERSIMVRRARLCYNCLKSDHIIKSCPSPRRCKRCGQKHHTLLHEDKSVASSTAKESSKTVQSNHASEDDAEEVVMTAVILIPDKLGKYQPCRVLIDPASQAHLISVACSDMLGLEREASNVKVMGVGETLVGPSKGQVSCSLYSRVSHHSLEVKLHVMDKVSGQLPSVKVNKDWNHLEGLPLADPRWNQPGHIDILLGVKYFHKILLWRRRLGQIDDAPVAWETIFGWGVAGECPAATTSTITSLHVCVDTRDSQLRKFWEVEEPPRKRILTQEERKCEEHFLKTYSRDENGRFHVRIPFDEEKKKTLGKSREIALRRLQQVERRLARNPEHQKQYEEFMDEYWKLGHMTKLSKEECGERVGATNYLCHHFVTNESSSSTKFRIVYDAANETTTGVSLNDTMMVGATLQDDLFDLLLRFRIHAVVVKADIAKMFRQFVTNKADAEMHRILWRKSPQLPVEEYRLETVTYGTACAPNLATRCIQQLGNDCSKTYPEASKVLLQDTYIDDILTGTPTAEDAKNLFVELRSAVGTAGLDLRKWTSNNATVLNFIPEELRESKQLVFDDKELVKALGVQWHPATDLFRFKVPDFPEGDITKRDLLSNLAKVFDPLGLIGCVTLRGKFLLQELWKLSVKWDEKVTENVQSCWEEYKQDLQQLENLSIPRRITVSGAERAELCGFADSSERGFGGIVYLRSIYPNGLVEVRFITSKTRVSPIRQVTLPRLELCAAVLLAELVVHVKECLKLEYDMRLWSDSTIALTWIAAQPRRWKTYVANRVATIQELTPISAWKHVAGEENPADLASRGISVRELISCDLWWKGPKWLSEPVLREFEQNPVAETDLEEKKQVMCAAVAVVKEHPVLIRYSSLRRLKRITAWFVRYLKLRYFKVMEKGQLQAEEINRALLMWVLKVQQQFFSEDYKLLKRGQPVRPHSKLRSLYPYIDKFGVIRVSGRLEHANVPEHRKHQIILPKTSHLSELIVDHYHTTTFHGGFQLTWNSIQNEFWILGGRDMTRHLVRKCVRCRRFRAKAAEQLMGVLPSPRVNPCRPFLHTGVDFAGPFMLKDFVGRVPKKFKGYMCIFICMTTKAVHLEAASALSTEAFIATFRRFVSRRGLVAHVYSDQGTNFVGAEKELRDFVSSEKVGESIGRELGDSGVTWHFNPPSAPHVGGLWEAGVKSAKHHLRRIMGNSLYNWEQFATLLAQVEGVLNSRPLYPRSADPADYQPLTPGHFLIGCELNAAPDSSWLDIPTNRLSQFQRLQQQLQQFWLRWSREYLNTLQQRNKWMWERENAKVGDLVLIIEDTPPATWSMGRIIEVYPSKDGKVRAVCVKTATTVLKRVTAKLVPLINDDN